MSCKICGLETFTNIIKAQQMFKDGLPVHYDVVQVHQVLLVLGAKESIIHNPLEDGRSVL